MASPEFSWPWQYGFPPFFTLQPNMDTRKKQMEGWSALILAYCRHHKIFVLDLPAALSNSLPLFHNKEIERRLSSDALKAIFEYLHDQGQCDWLDGKERNSPLIFWKTPTEWGNLIYNWAVNTGNTDTVCTIFELTEGDDISGEEFAGIDDRALVKALTTLEQQRRAEIIRDDNDDIQGVKFF